ncbi:MAG: hypothetical protein ACI9CF_001540, partial [Candidatus Omnitrophota bacterium]
MICKLILMPGKRNVHKLFFALSLSLCLGSGCLPYCSADDLRPPQNLVKTDLEHFVLYSEKLIKPNDLLILRRQLMNVRRQIGQKLGNYFPKKKFDVFLTTESTFRRYSKMGDHVAGLFDGRIHLPLIESAQKSAWLKSILWHEYSHAVVWLLSRGRCPSWLNEGLAVYHEEDIISKRLKQLHQMDTGYLLSLNELVPVMDNLQSQNSEVLARAYTTAYIGAAYLHSRYSSKSIRDLLEDLAQGETVQQVFERRFRLNMDVFEAKIHSFIKAGSM